MKLKISVFVWIFGVYMALTGKIQLFLSYVIALVLHEWGHAFTAKRLGYKLTELKIMPYGACISGEFGGIIKVDEIKIAFMGPLVNFCTAVIFIAVWWIFPEFYFFTQDFVTANLILGIFNLLPIFPMDGGRVLFALLGSGKKAYKCMRIFAFIVAGICLFLFAITLKTSVNYTFVTAAVFMITSALSKDNSAVYKRAFDIAYRQEKCKKGCLCKIYATSPETKLSFVLKKLTGSSVCLFVVEGEDMILRESDFDLISPDISPNTPIRELNCYKRKKKS